VFKFGNGGLIETHDYIYLPCALKGRSVLLKVWVVPGMTPFLVSKPTMKAMGAELKMKTDEMVLADVDNVTLPMAESKGGHYLLNLVDFEDFEFNIDKEP
jgi:hypothetical protein